LFAITEHSTSLAMMRKQTLVKGTGTSGQAQEKLLATYEVPQLILLARL